MTSRTLTQTMAMTSQAWLCLLLILTLQACSEPEPAQRASPAPAQSIKVSDAPLGASENGLSLATDWSANGFEQLGQQYEWGGSGARGGGLEPHFWLAAPETDDTLWSSECADGGKVKTTIYLPRPADHFGDSINLRFETDISKATLDYPATYVSGQQSDGFEFIQGANDPMFADMKTGKWAYVQLGEGPLATRLRMSLTNTGNALDAFLPACVAR